MRKILFFVIIIGGLFSIVWGFLGIIQMLFFESQFEKALKIFGALIEDDDVSPTLSNRAKVYRNICQKKSTPPTYTPETFDDMLNMMVLHLNLRQLPVLMIQPLA